MEQAWSINVANLSKVARVIGHWRQLGIGRLDLQNSLLCFT